MKILKTANYALFNLLHGNRDINLSHARKIAKSMLAQGQESPIKVNEKMEIIDGQHRLYAAKSINIPILYYIAQGSGIDSVLAQNTNSRNWNSKDLLNLHCKNKKAAYLQLKAFSEKYPMFSIPILCNILTLKTQASRIEKDGILSYDFRDGNFRITDIEKSENLVSMLLDFEDYVKIGNAAFVRAFMGIWSHEKYCHDKMLQKLPMIGKKLKGCNSITAFKEALIEVYNFKNKNKVDFSI